MPTYEQINLIERQLYDAFNDLKNIFEHDDFRKIMLDAQKYEIERREPVDFLNIEHNKMIFRIYTYLINKIPSIDAKELIKEEFKYKEPIIVSRLVDDIYTQQKHRMRPQKIYAAHMMKLAGVSNKKIATVLQVTSTTVAQYLKTSLVIKD